ncbi:MAG TPA: aldose 1-epimerase [Bryobacteraceae bacterium]|nr:aldose 1-epimerase [Bryobacteraceae bacterium]
MNSTTNYSVRRESVDGVDIVRLADAARRTEAAIAPANGNMACELNVGGRNALWFPYSSPAAWRAKPSMCGVPFLAPWANRLDGDAYWANGKRYLLNPGAGALHRDANGRPIHGLLRYSPAWRLEAAAADESGAWAASRFDFWKHPDLMAQFPFAHTIEMTYRLATGVLEVETAIENLSSDPMPVAIGFHPYFQLHDAPRDQWKAHLAARKRAVLDEFLIPSGELQKNPFPDPYPLVGGKLDDVFTDLERDADGRAAFWVEGAGQRIEVAYGPKFRVAVVYAPEGQNFICFEPMAALTNAFNLAHAGRYPELQSIAPGERWRESFWISVSGF